MVPAGFPTTTGPFVQDGKRTVMKYLGYCSNGTTGYFTVPGVLITLNTEFPHGMLVKATTGEVERTYYCLTGSTDIPGAWTQLSSSVERPMFLWDV
jgi:hypothetical protein